MQSQQHCEHEIVHAIVLSPNGSEVLLRRTDQGFVLPSVQIPRWERLAENLTAGIRRDWGCEAICLFTAGERAKNPQLPDDHYEVMQCWQDLGDSWDGTWCPFLSLAINSFRDMGQFRTVELCLRELNSYERDPSAPFAKRGWLTELTKWIADIIDGLGLELMGRFQQFNASPTFSLIRFETSGPAAWFKAVGEPNLQEFPITLKLTELFPTFMPQILGTKPDWNGWLSREASGTSLSETKDVVLWQQAAADLASLQIESISNDDLLLESGAHDVRFDVLFSAIEPFFDLVARLMDAQSKVTPPILSRGDLSLVRVLVEDALTMLQDLGIPDTLGHLDLNPGNIIVDSSGTRFLDWAEAYVGHPFFSLEYLLQHFRREIGSGGASQSQVVEAYKERCRQLDSHNRINDALAFVPLAAVFAYAVGINSSKDEDRLRDPKLAGYFRALARRMHREATHFIERRSQCLN